MRTIGRYGFSLIEVMVVVAIVVVIVVMAIPNYQVWVANNRLRSDMLDIRGGLQIARMTAMATGQTTTVELIPGVAGAEANTWRVFIDNGGVAGGNGVARDGIWNGCETIIGESGKQQVPSGLCGGLMPNLTRTLKGGITFPDPISVTFSSSGRRVIPPGNDPVSTNLVNANGNEKAINIIPSGEIL
ncbi:MAG: prepilin-type N-terminal cleavage/methylation domain-containing protein [Nitrospirota bacterium]